MSLETRVSDQLVEILDFSDQFTSQFLASLAHKCSSVNEIIEKLVAHTLLMWQMQKWWVFYQSYGERFRELPLE